MGEGRDPLEHTSLYQRAGSFVDINERDRSLTLSLLNTRGIIIVTRKSSLQTAKTAIPRVDWAT